MLHEAHLLAQLLRTGRVVVLLGDSASDRSQLIERALVPMLARRAEDHGRPSPAAEPSLDRRRTPGTSRECVARFDRWKGGVGGPLPHLRHAIAASLGLTAATLEQAPARLDEALKAWTITPGARRRQLFLLLDRFEDHLLAPHASPEDARLADELARVLRQPDLPVSVLLSLSTNAQAQLASLRSLVPWLEDMTLRLGPGIVTPAEENSPQTSPPDGDGVEARRGATERVPLRSDDVYALIQTTLSRVATGNPAHPLLTGRPAERQNQDDEFRPPTPEADTAKAPTSATMAEDLRGGAPNASGPPLRGPWWRRLLGRR